jgi:hypothetical protein
MAMQEYLGCWRKHWGYASNTGDAGSTEDVWVYWGCWETLRRLDTGNTWEHWVWYAGNARDAGNNEDVGNTKDLKDYWGCLGIQGMLGPGDALENFGMLGNAEDAGNTGNAGKHWGYWGF